MHVRVCMQELPSCSLIYVSWHSGVCPLSMPQLGTHLINYCRCLFLVPRQSLIKNDDNICKVIHQAVESDCQDWVYLLMAGCGMEHMQCVCESYIFQNPNPNLSGSHPSA